MPSVARPGGPASVVPVGGRRDSAGLSSVLGAILLFGLLVSTLVTIQAQYVPVWDHEREAKLMEGLSTQVATVQATLDHQVAGITRAPAVVPLTLAPPTGFSFFTGSTAPGKASFKPSSAGVGLSLAASRATLPTGGDPDVYVLSETWSDLTNGQTVSQVGAVDHLRFRILEPEPLTNGQQATLQAIDANGATAGRLVISNSDSGSDYTLRVQVFGRTSAPLTEFTDGWKKQSDVSPYYVDALSPSFGFDAVLASAPKPLSLKWTVTMPAATGPQMALAYRTPDETVVGAPGELISGFSHAADGGRLVVQRANQRFPAQTYIVEYGAVLLKQPDGAAMVLPPSFSVRSAPDQVALAWTLPELLGPPADLGGARSAQLAVQPLGPRTALHCLMPDLTITLQTDYPSVWESYWKATLRGAGLRDTPSTGQFAVTTTATSATLKVFGPRVSLSDPTNDLSLDVQEATLGVTLLPTG